MDASNGPNLSFVGLCAILRDSYAELWQLKPSVIQVASQQKNVEAIDTVEVLSWIKYEGWQRVLIE